MPKTKSKANTHPRVFTEPTGLKEQTIKSGVRTINYSREATKTVVRNSGGELLFTLKEGIGGAWSERRVVAALYQAYKQGALGA